MIYKQATKIQHLKKALITSTHLAAGVSAFLQHLKTSLFVSAKPEAERSQENEAFCRSDFAGERKFWSQSYKTFFLCH